MAHPVDQLNASLTQLSRSHPDRWRVTSCGVTPALIQIPALLHREAYATDTARTRALLIAGLSGAEADTALALQALEALTRHEAEIGADWAWSAIPCGNPDGDRDLSRGYPPEGHFFNHPEEAEKRYLWRWICFQAPGLVLELRSGESVSWQGNPAAIRLAAALGGVALDESDSLLGALGQGHPDKLGVIPGLRLTSPSDQLEVQLRRLVDAISGAPLVSAAQDALQARRARSPLEVARILASLYGYVLDTPVNYTQGVGISGRLRFASLAGGDAATASGIAQLVEPYVSQQSPLFGDQPTGANLAGLLWGPELAEATGDRRYSDLVIEASDRYQPAAGNAAPPPSDPDFRCEDMFTGGAMLGRAYRLTSKTGYLDLLVKFLQDAHIQQANGLFWHCRSAPYFWSRGNGFAALGLTETLTYLPENYPHQGEVLEMYRRLLDGMLVVQHPSGMFTQLLDYPGSYQELTATCMMVYALARGLRQGWLAPSYRNALDATWRAVSEHVDDTGNVMDGCASTGVQGTVKEYLDRPAVFGYDDRTGGMALWCAIEMARLDRV
ncbi:MAG: glycoside hydrolase family 88 protein [Dehalococcoidia bacterium]